MTLCVSSGENKNKMELNLYNSIANFTVPKGDNNLSLSLVRCTSTRRNAHWIVVFKVHAFCSHQKCHNSMKKHNEYTVEFFNIYDMICYIIQYL
jgi:hypothetical protein